ncbi:hypothetical protein TorRG33x02_005610 [Trema orientale]|uniref:Uncharacterized protein n=1 Tax=Trema orientale TaxID=63057 RepID=A0A2P5FZY8_TREOI|nr:hypothetical protein TorRG33x02_005610 [Trema orientale]
MRLSRLLKRSSYTTPASSPVTSSSHSECLLFKKDTLELVKHSRWGGSLDVIIENHSSKSLFDEVVPAARDLMASGANKFNPSPPWTTPPISAIPLPSLLYLARSVQWSLYDKADFEFNDRADNSNNSTPPTVARCQLWNWQSTSFGQFMFQVPKT